jgi:positive regulator of sigma E activity
LAEQPIPPLSARLSAALPYVLPVLGAAIGMFWARYGTEHSNPVLWVAGGAVAGRLLAMVVVRMLDRAALNAPRKQQDGQDK